MKPVQYHSHIGHAAYIDLLRLHRDEVVAELRGTPELRKVRKRTYWYDRYRVGEKVVSRYIGEDTAELRKRLERQRHIRASAQDRERERARLVRVLRAEGYSTLDATTGKLLRAFAAAGVFRLGGTLVGTVAFRLYEAELGVRLGFEELAQTLDMDIASFERLSLALSDQVTEAIGDVLKDFQFDAVPSTDHSRTWRWRQATRQTEVEFLTPAFGEEGIRELPALGVSAQALHHLNFLIADPIPAAAPYRSGVLVQIPRPERFAVHKLIVADRRKAGIGSQKSRKDRAQAAFLIDVLAEDRPAELAEAYEDAVSRGPKWRRRIAASLKRMPDSKARLDEAVASMG